VFWVRIFNFVPAGFVFSNHRNPQTLGFVAQNPPVLSHLETRGQPACFLHDTPRNDPARNHRRIPKRRITILPELFSRFNCLKLNLLPFPLQPFPSRPPTAECYFQTSLRRLCHAGVFRLTCGSRPSRRTEPNPRFRSLTAKILFAVRADLSSPQGVRSVGRRLFDNLILQLLQPRRRCVWATHFIRRAGPTGQTPKAGEFPQDWVRCAARQTSPFGFVFSNSQWHLELDAASLSP